MAPRGTRVLVALTAWIATLILAVETRRYSGQKRQSLQLCKKYLPHDERTRLATTINDLCKGSWGYALPDRTESRSRLRSLCRETLALENEYLRIIHDYLVAQLPYASVQKKLQALRIVQDVVYQDNEIMVVLETLTRDADEAVQTSATKTLEILKHTIRAQGSEEEIK